MKKRLLATLLTICMVLALWPTAVFAEDESNPANSLPTAENGVITLVSDVTLTEKYTVSQETTVKIDLAGHTLTVPGIENNGTLTIVNTNGNIAAGDTAAKGVITTTNNGNNTSDTTPALITNNGTLSLEAGTVLVPNDLGYYGVLNKGIFTMGTDKDSAVAIQGGTKNALRAEATDNDGNGSAVDTTINGGAITGNATTIYNRGGTLTIHDATVNVTTGQAIISNGGVEGNAYVKGGALNINGGTFTSTATVMISTASETRITGGNFTLTRTGTAGDQSYIMSLSGGADAALSNCTMTNNTTRTDGSIGSDFGICGTGTGTITIGEGVTITSPNAALKDLSNDSAKIVIDGGKLTSTGAEAVKITTGNAGNSTITVNGGEITGKTNGIQVSAGTVTIQGGTITGETEAAVEIEGTSSEFKGLTIQNGENGTSPMLVGGGEDKTAVSMASEQTNRTILVSGGSFSTSVAEYVVDGLNYEAKSSEGVYTYHATLDEALTTGGEVSSIAAATSVSTAVTVKLVDGASTTSIKAVENDKITLPNPTKPGYYFLGWSDDSETYPGDREYTVPAGGATLTAQWVYIPPTYSVAAPSDVEGGEIAVSPKRAISGQTVTLTVTPDEGYELDSLTVTDAKGNLVTLTDKGDGKYTFQMPASRVSITAGFKAIETEPEPDPVKDCQHDESCPLSKFTDVKPDAWYHDGIHYCIAGGMMQGTSADTFDPEGTMTRAMLVTVLARLDGQDTTPAEGQTWYAPGMDWAVQAGVSDGTNPNGAITREQLATMLYRYAGEPETDGTLDSFTDAGKVSDYAETAVQWAVEQGIINGKGGGILDPKSSATRAEVAAMLMRYCETIGK